MTDLTLRLKHAPCVLSLAEGSKERGISTIPETDIKQRSQDLIERLAINRLIFIYTHNVYMSRNSIHELFGRLRAEGKLISGFL